MNKIVFLDFFLVCFIFHHAYAKGKSEEEDIEELWGKPAIDCPPYDMPRPPGLLPHLPNWAKYVKLVCLYNSQYYYTENFTPDNLDPDLCSHLNYEFAFLDDTTYQLIPGDPKLDLHEKFYKRATDLAKQNRNLKVFISIGGWADSTEKYSELVKSSEKRANFIKHVIQFMKDHSFHGLDVAWEYPNAWQGKVGICKEDKDNFSIFLKELKQAFKTPEYEYGLSISVSANVNEMDAAYDVATLTKIVDHFNVMTYDLHGHWEGKTGHHAQFNSSDTEDASYMINSLEEWVKRGADKKKLVVGVPAYGRTFKLHDPSHCGLGEKIDGAGDPGPITKDMGYMAFNEICYMLEHDNWTVVEDETSGAYAYKDDQWVSYDSLESIAQKIKYIIKNGFAGIALKDITGDDYKGCCFNKYKFPLLLAINEKILENCFAKQQIFF